MAGAPLIGVSTSIIAGKEGERAALNSAYLTAVQGAGGVPILLPPQIDGRARRELFKRLHGVLLTGGGDVNPKLFKQPRHKTVSGVSDARDALEIALVEHALARRLPVLAICRGLQVLNVALGGSLYQDVASASGTSVEHGQTAPRHEPTHKVRVASGSRLERVLGVDELEVNSFHHQAIKTVTAPCDSAGYTSSQREGAPLMSRSRTRPAFSSARRCDSTDIAAATWSAGETSA